MLDPEQFDFNLAMGTDTYGPDSKPRAVYEERPKFGQFYIEFRDAVTQELRYKLKSGEITKNQLFEIVYFADYRMKKGKATFTMPHHTGSSTIHVYLRKMSGSIVAYNYELRFDK